MQVHSDRFETVLPKARFFTPKPAVQSPAEKPIVSYLLVGVLVATVAMAAISKFHEAPRTVAAPVAVQVPAPPLPDPQPVHEQVFAPVPTAASAPRAQLIHIRPLGTYENDRMPDGRTLTTLYKGELPNVGHLPTTGAQLGDMWFTRADNHCWVLAPVTTGSQAVGWVDP